ncbi:Eco57I restriction-modification methylase domain-containing protein [Hymenobacter actinosclerus]|uniref:site-specific DNA-methyltransferase (adenine-specific) n=1 Tax=Hymenobacter actinosclerus TaxID=82805 RepID=A0A1I0E4Z0_9BACT|nr:DNA methyltransferase [Hymenobacter actinosclerus]SET39713.1 type II restriction m6 adenine DNA methyltransferase, Alw26I/Eco31I/Esp3I family [Hymenobacter actinosclerus]
MFQPLSKEQARLEIARLVENFTHQLPDYKRGRYSETEVRIHYINPFFKALGWDVNNDNGASSAYCEVVHEAKVRVGKATKAPDYLFRLPGGQNLFFLEAKKPSVDIKDDVQPAYQVRRYGWNAKMALSLLTDFEELAVYDCTVQPDPKDKARKARLHYLTFDEYADKFDFLWDNFSKESVLRGNLDRFVASGSNRRGKETVDRAFLDTLEQMRAALARGLAARNPRLDAEQLRFLVQMLLDRLIFLRITEDRGVEAYGDLQAVLKTKGKDGSIYKALLGRFREAQNRYNSGLFDLGKDELSAKVQLGDDVLTPLINGLYYPESPYEFSVIGADILGSAYERFLGKVIELQADGTVVIEEKPEVRKAGGVFYTPAYIVEYIVKQTVGKLCEGSSPQQVARLRIVDPACGSGSFLLGAYQFLLDWHLNYYQTHPKAALPPTLAPAGPAKKGGPAARPPGSGKALTPDGHLTTAVKKTILLNNLYGVDLDEQAVEVTKLSLLLKCLEGETSASMQQSLGLERVLPTIDQNIRVGNSLVDIDFYDGELDFAPGTERAVKPFSWRDEFADVFRQGGFDAVIGNPPYDVLEKERLGSDSPHELIHKYLIENKKYKDALGGKLNLFRFFVIKFIDLCKPSGQFGLIIPLSILADISCAKSRAFVFKSSRDLSIDCFPQKDNPINRIFLEAKLSTVILIGTKDIIKPAKKFTINTYPGNNLNEQHKAATIQLKELKKVDSKNLPVPLIDELDWSILKNIYSNDEVVRFDDHKTGFKITRGEVNQTILRKYIDQTPNKARMLKGVEVGRYIQNSKLSQGFREWFDEEEFLIHNNPKAVVKLQRIATQRITGVDEKLRIVATIIEPDCYFADSTNSVVKVKSGQYDLSYALALLNSKLFQWRFKLTSTNNNVGTNELESLPFRLLKDTDQQHHDTIVAFVGQLLALHPQLRAATGATAQSQLQARIRRLDQRLDHLVYLLYGLSYAEAQVVEPGLAQRLSEAEYAVWPQA